jgi:hypothetical protein
MAQPLNDLRSIVVGTIPDRAAAYIGQPAAMRQQIWMVISRVA